MSDSLPLAWANILAAPLATAQARALGSFLRAEEAAGKVIYPPRGQRLRALELTAPDDAKVVILGQDPYHGPGQAHGLAFSVPHGVAPPPSLANIFRELADDLAVPAPGHGNLEQLARRGVLLLNTTLTVEHGKAGSHAKRGWEGITDAIVAAIAQRAAPAVFILWGSHAQAKAARLAGLGADQGGGSPHLVLQSPHPSPLSAYRGFFGSKPFSRANAFLEQTGQGAIDWRA